MTEFGSHLCDLDLVDSILRDFVDDLVHLDEQLSPNGKLVDDFLLHAHIVALVLAEQCAGRADTCAVLYANDFKFAIVLKALVFSGLRLADRKRLLFFHFFSHFLCLFCFSYLSL